MNSKTWFCIATIMLACSYSQPGSNAGIFSSAPSTILKSNIQFRIESVVGAISNRKISLFVNGTGFMGQAIRDSFEFRFGENVFATNWCIRNRLVGLDLHFAPDGDSRESIYIVGLERISSCSCHFDTEFRVAKLSNSSFRLLMNGTGMMNNGYLVEDIFSLSNKSVGLGFLLKTFDDINSDFPTSFETLRVPGYIDFSLRPKLGIAYDISNLRSMVKAKVDNAKFGPASNYSNSPKTLVGISNFISIFSSEIFLHDSKCYKDFR